MLRSAVISWGASLSVNGKLTDAISRIKREVFHAETLQHVVVVFILVAIGVVWLYEIIGTERSLKQGGI
jgi:uncharacterized protein (DUF486 family)